MAAEHEPFDGPRYHFYYEYEPIVSRTRDESIHPWPAFIDVVGERGGRLPR